MNSPVNDNDKCGAPQSPGCIHPVTHYVSYPSTTAGVRYGNGPLQPATVYTRVCGWCVDGIPNRLSVELLSEIAPSVQLADADVNESASELQSAVLSPTAYRRMAAEFAYDRLAHWVGDDATREIAAAALATAKFRTGLSDEIRDLVLDRFEPERVPVAGVDFLPAGEWGELP